MSGKYSFFSSGYKDLYILEFWLDGYIHVTEERRFSKFNEPKIETFHIDTWLQTKLGREIEKHIVSRFRYTMEEFILKFFSEKDAVADMTIFVSDLGEVEVHLAPEKESKILEKALETVRRRAS